SPFINESLNVRSEEFGFFSRFGCSQPWRARVITGITTQVKSTTTKALKTALFKTKFQERINGPRVRLKTMTTGTTPRYVAMAIFHWGKGCSASPGKVNQLSRPQSSSTCPLPSVRSVANWFHSKYSGEVRNATRALRSENVRMMPYWRDALPGAGRTTLTPIWPGSASERRTKLCNSCSNSFSRPGLAVRMTATCMGSFIVIITSSEKKGDGGGEIVDVLAASLIDVAPGKEENVGSLQTDVSLRLPGQVNIERRADVNGCRAKSRNRNESGHAVNGVVARVPPEHVYAAVCRDALGQF